MKAGEINRFSVKLCNGQFSFHLNADFFLDLHRIFLRFPKVACLEATGFSRRRSLQSDGDHEVLREVRAKQD